MKLTHVFRPMRPEHEESVFALWRENLPGLSGVALPERHRWSSTLNPAGTSETVLAILTERNEVAGSGSVCPRTLWVNGESVTCGLAVDLVVARNQRLGAAALGIARMLIADSRFPVIVGFPNKSALPIFQRVGYRAVTSAAAWVKPLRTAYKVREYVKFNWLSRAVARVGDAILIVLDAGRRPRGGRRAVISDVVDRADERFDELWMRGRSRYTVAGVRTARYLNWRYGAFGTPRTRFFCLRLKNSAALVGYVAFSTTNNKVFVADLFALDMEQTAEMLLLQFSKAMRAADCQSIFIEYAGNQAFTSCLLRAGFFRADSAERKLVALVRSSSDEATKALLDERSWHLFAGELDL